VNAALKNVCQKSRFDHSANQIPQSKAAEAGLLSAPMQATVVKRTYDNSTALNNLHD